MSGDAMAVRDVESTSTGLAVRDRGYLSSQDVLARMTRILEIQKHVMKEKVHFGTIPGTPKPTLYKAGAEKLLATFQIAGIPTHVEDLSTADEIRYRVHVQGVNQITGTVLGEAVGECSSNEEKYRWRKPVCEQEYDETPDDQRRMVWKKYDGKPYKAKQVRTSPADVANTILQMATKRGLVPMTRVVLACSDIFDQDLEDMPEELRESILEHEGAATTKPDIQAPQRKGSPVSTSTPAAGAVFVTGTSFRNGKTNGHDWKLYLIKFSDGREGGTLDPDMAGVAERARTEKLGVIPVLEPGKRDGTFKLTELAIAATPSVAATETTPEDLE